MMPQPTMLPGAGTKIILEQATKDVDNFLDKYFIIICCGSNDIGRVKLSTVLKSKKKK
jgi:hypothetical protein